jgi:hypothetical protein
MAQNAGDNPAAKQADANFGHYQFRDGESLDDLHIHYAVVVKDLALVCLLGFRRRAIMQRARFATRR